MPDAASDTSDTPTTPQTGDDGGTDQGDSFDADAGTGAAMDSGNGSPGDQEDAGLPPPNPVPEPDTGALLPFFLPTGEPDNTSAPRVEVDGQGGIHAVYPAYAGGGAYYAYCSADCTGPEAVRVVYLPTDGTVANAMLALTEQGAPRVLLSSYQLVYFASCDADCTASDKWELGAIFDHDADQEITGESLALDQHGNPHFLVHTYRAYLGIGQKEPETLYASCASGSCTTQDAWQYGRISDQIWEDAHLLFDADGRAHVAMVANVMEDNVATEYIAGYATCAGACDGIDDWEAVGLAYAYTSETEVVSIRPSVALALTSDDNPRVLALAVSEDGGKNLDYFECDADCTQEGFQGVIVSEHDAIGAGIDLALDAQDRPRLVYTLDYNIGLAYCDELPCAGPEASWDLTPVELSSSMPPDEILPYPNCTVSAWFLHSPSLALDAAGAPRVGYQARDISGGWETPTDPTESPCVAGTDMTWSRLAVMSSHAP